MLPTLPPRIVAEMAKPPSRRSGEDLEVVVVAESVEAALSLSVQGIRALAIVSAGAFGPPVPNTGGASMLAVPPGVPVVAGVEGIFSVIANDLLVLVDGDRGLVVVDPDPEAVSAFQAERERLAPRRRLHLGFGHQPARTLDGRLIRTISIIGGLADAHQAVEEGADALFVPASVLVDADTDDEAQLDTLQELATAAQGKPATMSATPEEVSAEALLRAAAVMELTWAVPQALGTEGVRQVEEYLSEVAEELLARDEASARPGMALLIRADDEPPLSLDGLSVSRVVLDLGGVGLRDPEVQLIEDVAVVAMAWQVPVEVALPEWSPEWIETALRLGAAGLIVPPERVGETKEVVRNLIVDRSG